MKYAFSQAVDANEEDNSKEFFIAVKYEADLVIKGYVHKKISVTRNHVHYIWGHNACTNDVHSYLFLCSSSKPDQVIYSGAVKERKKIEEFQEEIGPEIVQTIMVGWYETSLIVLDQNC